MSIRTDSDKHRGVEAVLSIGCVPRCTCALAHILCQELKHNAVIAQYWRGIAYS